MTGKAVEQIVHFLASELALASICRASVETQRKTILGRDIVELRVFLHTPPLGVAADPWLWHYRNDLVAVLGTAGLELAVDEWFTPSRQVPSCSCWIMRPEVASESKKVKHGQKPSRFRASLHPQNDTAINS